MPALKPYRPQQLVRELVKSLRRELDLAGECRHAERIAANMAPLPWIVIPRVHWAHTGERVNVQDFVTGEVVTYCGLDAPPKDSNRRASLLNRGMKYPELALG